MAEETPTPRLSRRLQLPLIWVVPVVAAVVAGWMVYREWRQRGPEIAIKFSDGAGVQVSQTKLQYKGVVVGTVSDVSLDDDLHGVTVRVRLRRHAAALARRGAEFWIVHPQIGFSGVSGLETLVAGVHLNVRPGNGPRALRFRGLDQPPPRERPGEGQAYRLYTDHLGTMQPGAPVFYREFQVGEVEDVHLDANAESVVVRVRVRTAYTNLVRRNTRFWNAGGVPVDINLFGAEVQTSSLRSFFTGAVAFATPDTSEKPAPDDTPFRMFAAPEEEWLKWHPRIPVSVPNEAAPQAAPPPNPLSSLMPDGDRERQEP